MKNGNPTDSHAGSRCSEETSSGMAFLGLFLAQVRIIFLASRVSTLKRLFVVDEWQAFFQDAARILDWFRSQVRFQRGLKSRSIEWFVPRLLWRIVIRDTRMGER